MNRAGHSIRFLLLAIVSALPSQAWVLPCYRSTHWMVGGDAHASHLSLRAGPLYKAPPKGRELSLEEKLAKAGVNLDELDNADNLEEELAKFGINLVEELAKMKESEEKIDITDEEILAHVEDWDERVPSHHTVTLVGRIGNEPRVFRSENGGVVVSVDLACQGQDRSQDDIIALGDDEDIEEDDNQTEWFPLEIWGPTADFVANYVEKGTRVSVIGTLKTSEWVDKETGENRDTIKVLVEDFQVLETKEESELRRSKRGHSFFSKEEDSFFN